MDLPEEIDHAEQRPRTVADPRTVVLGSLFAGLVLIWVIFITRG